MRNSLLITTAGTTTSRSTTATRTHRSKVVLNRKSSLLYSHHALAFLSVSLKSNIIGWFSLSMMSAFSLFSSGRFLRSSKLALGFSSFWNCYHIVLLFLLSHLRFCLQLLSPYCLPWLNKLISNRTPSPASEPEGCKLWNWTRNNTAGQHWPGAATRGRQLWNFMFYI
jgi:hypothetical protein